MTELETVEIGGLTYDVIAREPATASTPLTGGKVTKHPTVHKLLLNTGAEVFQCAHPNRGECRKVADTVNSITAHQRSHSDRTVAKKANAKLAEVEKREKEEHARRSQGISRANEAKRQRHAAEVTSTDPQVARVQRQLSDLAVTVEKIAATLPPLAEMIRATNEELGAIVLANHAKAADIDITKLGPDEKLALLRQLVG
jgi:hypothetical protein